MKKEAFMSIVRSKFNNIDAEQERVFSAIGESIEEAYKLDTAEREKAVAVQIGKIVGECEEGKTIADVVRSVTAKVAELEAKGRASMSDNDKYALRKKLEEKREEIVRARNSDENWAIEFRAKRAASAVMTTTSVVTTAASAITNPNLFDDMDIAIIRVPKNFIIDAIDSRQVAKVPANITRKEEVVAGDGVPAATSEGATKPKIDKKFEMKVYSRVKYSAHMVFTEELEMDFDQLVIEIIAMFERDVIKAWQDGVFAKIQAYAKVYDSSSLDGTIAKPNVNNVILALKTRVESKNFTPDVVFANPSDVATMFALQDSNGLQMFIPQEYMYHGLTPYINNVVPKGKIIVGESKTVREQHGPFIVRKGTINDQLILNEQTIVGEVFSVVTNPTLYADGWCLGTIATVKTALKATAQP